MRVRDVRVVRIQAQKVRREAQFQRNLKLAFQGISGSSLKIEKKTGLILIEYSPNRSYVFEDFFLNEWCCIKRAFPWKRSPRLKNARANHQIYEHLKNVYVHGGNATIGLRIYYAFKRGKWTKVHEAVVWDNGEGIKDLERAVEIGWSSHSERWSKFHGGGMGLDYGERIGQMKNGVLVNIMEYAADEIIIESGYQMAFRRFKTDQHHFKRSRINVPGTKVTTRFWVEI